MDAVAIFWIHVSPSANCGTGLTGRFLADVHRNVQKLAASHDTKRDRFPDGFSIEKPLQSRSRTKGFALDCNDDVPEYELCFLRSAMWRNGSNQKATATGDAQSLPRIVRKRDRLHTNTDESAHRPAMFQ
jgi:hypothetical protein